MNPYNNERKDGEMTAHLKCIVNNKARGMRGEIKELAMNEFHFRCAGDTSNCDL